jgi:DNA-binding Lrp family transcriptional regulator
MRKDRARNEALILMSIAMGINTWSEIAKEVNMHKRPVHAILQSLEKEGLIKGIRSGHLRGVPNTKKVFYELPVEDSLKFALISSKIFDLTKYAKTELTKKLKEYMRTDAYYRGCQELSTSLQEKLGSTPSKFIWQEGVDTAVPKEVQDKAARADDDLILAGQKAASSRKYVAENGQNGSIEGPEFSSAKEELLRSQLKYVESMIEKLELNPYSLTVQRYMELWETHNVFNNLVNLFNEKSRQGDSDEEEPGKLKESIQRLDQRLAGLFFPFLIPFSLYGGIESKIKEKAKYSEYLVQILLSFPDSAKRVLDDFAARGGLDNSFDHAEVVIKSEGKERGKLIVYDLARYILASAIMNIDISNVIIPEGFLLKYFDVPMFAFMNQ